MIKLPNDINQYQVFNKQSYLHYKDKLNLLLDEFSKSNDKLSKNYIPKKIKFDSLNEITLIVYEDEIIAFASVLDRDIWPKNISRIFNRLLRNKKFEWENPTFGIISKLIHDYQIEYCKKIGKDFVFISIEGNKRLYLKRWIEQANEYSPEWTLCNEKKWVCKGSPESCLQHIIYKKISDINEPFPL